MRMIRSVAAPTSQTLKSALLAGGASAIVKKGLHKLFSNFTATLKKPTETISDLQFTTKTTGNINGDFTFNSSSPVMGLRALFSEDMIGGKLRSEEHTSELQSPS